MKKLRQILESLSDTRSLRQKMQDLHDHPTTEPHLKASAKSWLDKNKPQKPDNYFSRHTDRKTSGKPTSEGHGFYAYNPERKEYHGPYEKPESAMKVKNNINSFRKTTSTRTVHKGPGGWKEHSNSSEHGLYHNFDYSASMHSPL